MISEADRHRQQIQDQINLIDEEYKNRIIELQEWSRQLPEVDFQALWDQTVSITDQKNAADDTPAVEASQRDMVLKSFEDAQMKISAWWRRRRMREAAR